MTLFAIPFTCSLAVRFTLAREDVPHQLRWMRRFEHVLDDGAPFSVVNPKRRVPALFLDDGELLTEIPAVLAHLDQQTVQRSDVERRRVLEWCCYLATELHRPSLFLLFDPAAPVASRDDALARLLPPTLDHLASVLAERPVLVGDRPSVADDYLLWALTLLRIGHADRVPASLDAYRRRLTELPWASSTITSERAAYARAAS